VISKPPWHDLAVRMIKYSTSGKKFPSGHQKKVQKSICGFL